MAVSSPGSFKRSPSCDARMISEGGASAQNKARGLQSPGPILRTAPTLLVLLLVGSVGRLPAACRGARARRVVSVLTFLRRRRLILLLDRRIGDVALDRFDRVHARALVAITLRRDRQDLRV